MSQRHVIQNEALMFVTTNTLNCKPIFINPVHAREAVECLYRVQQMHPFLLFAFVIMPDHCHFLMQVPPPLKISEIIGAYKSGLTFDIGIAPLWQRRFDLRSPTNAWATLDYIHQNPVRAGLCEKVGDYPWSSASKKWEVTRFES